MEQKVMITSLPQAFRMVKEMNVSTEWDSDYREAGRRALQEILEGQMRGRIDRHLEEMARRGEADRRNGSFSRHLLTELGDIELHVARSRRTSTAVSCYLRDFLTEISHSLSVDDQCTGVPHGVHGS